MKKVIIALALSALALGMTAQVKSRISTRTGIVNQLETFGRVTYQGLNYYPVGKDSLLVKNDVNKADTVNIPAEIFIDNHKFNVVGLHEAAFENDTYLKHIVIPASITNIASSAFYSCSRMATCEMSNIKYIDDYAFSRSGLTHVVLPNGLTHIGRFAFRECENLRYVELPESLQTIGKSAFASCEIDTVKVNFATPIELDGPVFDIRSSQFKQPHTVLSVPSGSKHLFQNAEGWRRFKIIIEY